MRMHKKDVHIGTIQMGNTEIGRMEWCESLKFKGGTMMVMVPRQYFQLSNCVSLAVQ